MFRRKFTITTLLCLASLFGMSQQADSLLTDDTYTDTLFFETNQYIVGEIKSMDKGVIKMETDYSEEDFEIEWKKVRGIHTDSQFLIHVSDGLKYFGSIQSTSDSTVVISLSVGLGMSFDYPIIDVVYLSPLEKRFKDRFDATISFGLDMAKAQNLRSLSTRSSFAYKADKWSTKGAYNTLRSQQDEVDPIKRQDASINFNYVLKGKWFASATLNTLSNTELSLDSRVNLQLSVGNYLYRTNFAYLNGSLGINRNREQYTDDPDERVSIEGFLGAEFNLYDVGDLSLLLRAYGYPGITEKDRFRTDTTFDVKYDLPLDFFISMGLSLNTDNQPVEGAERVDYVVTTSFGWEW